MAWVEPTASGKFRARDRVNGKATSKTFATREAAWQWITGNASDPQLGGRSFVAYSHPPAGGSGSDTTLSEYLESGGFVTVHQAPSMRDFNNSMIEAHIRPRWGEISLGSISHGDVQRWALDVLDNGKRSPKTIKHIVGVFRRILDAALVDGLLEVNPASKVKTPLIVENEKRIIDTEQIAALRGAFRPEMSAFVDVCAFGGLRIGEAFGLRWRNVDLFAGRIDVRETVTDVGSARPTLGPPKTRAGRRAVSIPRVAVNALADHRNAGNSDADPDAFVFRGHAGGPVRSSNFRRDYWRPAVAKSKLAPLRPHDLRHTAVSLWIAAGASPKEVAVRAGHSSVAFTLDHYGHLYASEDAALTSRLDTLIRRGVN